MNVCLFDTWEGVTVATSTLVMSPAFPQDRKLSTGVSHATNGVTDFMHYI